ncbi:M20 aminoacylase family protein [Agrobacterium tumefaciens]|uniref:Peptidase M20 n=1 Tax=Agrobacterium tumefaciens TaxID=358 RepID=A0A2L2LM71_AGRTU|nr:M20 aminoacylase family protein [Agrobacterium tumefaciens]AVH45433.1 peptidase M20 [Agrobacterium tumefaciens]NSY99162.1 amidohydrolase [Agrobacterium tumefaciens]
MYSFLSSEEVGEAIKWRHHLHRNPELGFEEKETSAFIARRLAEWGFDVRTGYGRTGLVGSLRRGGSARAIGIRADIDALPIKEQTGLPYASANPGNMHACGHDGHISMALAAARACSRLAFDGTVHFIFQPAEENEGGGRVMVEDGLFRDIAMDDIYALHNWPALDLGQCVARDDRMMAAFGTFEICVRGRGAHGAMPHEGADPIVAAAQIVAALQTIASRNVSPLQSAVVSATQIHGGDAWNVIPEDVVIRGTTRWFEEEVGARIEARLRELAKAIAAGFGCTAHVDYLFRYPATINDPRCAGIVRDAAAAMGMATVDTMPSMAAEDFAFMLREKPGCYFWLGARRQGSNPGLHSAYFDFNDDLLPIGAGMWVQLVQGQLRTP